MENVYQNQIFEFLMKPWFKYAAGVVVGALVIAEAVFLPAEIFMMFLIGWIVVIPVTFAVISHRLRKIYTKQSICCI